MNYEEKYKQALERAKEELRVCGSQDCDAARQIFRFFPELKESEDEKIRKRLIKTFGSMVKEQWGGIAIEDILAWLEKQGNKIVDCQQNHQDVKYPNGGIVMEDFNGGEGFYKLHLDYLSKKQVEEVEEMVRTWNKESKTLNADEVIEWIKTHGNLFPIVTIRINDVIAKFKKDFGLC